MRNVIASHELLPRGLKLESLKYRSRTREHLRGIWRDEMRLPGLRTPLGSGP
jgi:hypothetical protein